MVATTFVLFAHTWDWYSLFIGVLFALLIVTALVLLKKRKVKTKTNFAALRSEIKKGHDALITANKEIITASSSFHNLNEVLNDVDK